MKYNLSEDIKSIREILGISQQQLADSIGAERKTVFRNETGKTQPSKKFLESLYSFAFAKKVRINRLKEMLWRDDLKKEDILLFHGAKKEITGKIDVHQGRKNNDFGQGFYAGESYEQALSFVSGFPDSSVYFLRFNADGLKCKKYEVNQDWMLTIAYYRGALDQYSDHPIIKTLIQESKSCDYIAAPIADNRMFEIINSFIAGELTDEQCRHCLTATNLGMQYVLVSEKAAAKAELLERCYISDSEREYYRNIRLEHSSLEADKVKLARRQYRGKGLYIDEILETKE